MHRRHGRFHEQTNKTCQHLSDASRNMGCRREVKMAGYWPTYQEMVYCCGSTLTIKLKTIGLLFLVAQRDFQRSQAQIFATDRKFFGTTIKSHWGWAA